jgi:excisionase family DNA binding protein
MSQILTVSDVAKRRGVCNGTILSAIYAGQLKATLHGNSYVIYEEDFQSYLKNLRGRGRPWKHPKPLEEVPA